MKTTSLFGFFIISIALVFISCSKESETNPVISLKKAQGYIYSDTSLVSGESVKIGIQAQAGDNNLVLIEIVYNGQIIDIRQINQKEYTEDFDFTKTNDEKETFQFNAKDSGDKIASIGITVKKKL